MPNPVKELREFWKRRRSTMRRDGSSFYTASGSPATSPTGHAILPLPFDDDSVPHPRSSISPQPFIVTSPSVDDGDSATKNSDRDGSWPGPKNPGSGAMKIGGWWEAHRTEIVNSTREVFEVVEKALDGCPVIGPKAAFGAAAGVLRAVQTKWENVDSLRDLAQNMDHLRASLEGSDNDMSSPALRERLSQLKIELKGYHGDWERQQRKPGFRQLIDAAHIERELCDLERRVSRTIDLFLFDSQLHVETVVDEIQRTARQIELAQIAREERDLLDKLHPVAAYHDAIGGPDACFQGTRASLLKSLLEWFRTDTRPIFWLSGLAGMGKSTVARTVADFVEKQGQLGATFFFTRADPTRRKPWVVLPTLAHQLAECRPELRAAVCGAIAADINVAQRNIDKQASALFGAAFAAVESPLPRTLIVLDALDDCEKSGEGRESLLTCLLDSVRAASFSVKILITSRPEESFEALLARPGIRSAVLPFALHKDTEPAEIEADIRHYLQGGFRKISKARSDSGDEIWPTPAQLSEIVRRSGQLFIYAATILRYVSDPDSLDSPRTRLAELLERPAAHAQLQYHMIDQLYVQLLEKASEVQATNQHEVCVQIRAVAGTLVLLAEPLSSASMSKLLGLTQDRTQRILGRLSALTFVDGASSVRLYHPSFQDFILSSERCTDDRFHVDEALQHAFLAQRCLHILNSHLKTDICDLRDPSVPNSREDIEGRVHEHISESLRYSATYWVDHFKAAATSPLSPELLKELSTFCDDHLLHWIEVVSLSSRLIVAEEGLRRMLELCETSEHERSLSYTKPLLNEASQLLTAYVLPIRTHALHVYYSALVTIGHGSRLEVYTPSVPGLPRLLSEPYPDWETESLPDGHHKWIHCLAFSPDGTRIISGSSDFTARIWNALDGNELWCLQGHQKKVTAVAFSADSTRAITASYDKMLRVWDVRTGEHVMTLEGHGQCITALVVSPDGACVASASYDGSVRVWSLDDGKQVAILDGHDARVTSVAFSQDGKRIVSGAHNGDIRVWDARTGTETIRLEGHSQVVSSVALSPGGTRLVSGSNDCTVRVWDLRTGKQLAVLQEHHKECVVLVTFSPDGRWVTARYEDGRERSWSTNSIIDSPIDGGTPLLDDAKPDEGPAANRFEWNYASGWISWKPSLKSPTTPLCWIPAEPVGHRRGHAFAASNARVAIGAPNGTVTILDLSETLSVMESARS